MTTETTSPLALPLRATDLGEIFDCAEFPLADVFPDRMRENSLSECADRAAEIVRRVNMHDELIAEVGRLTAERDRYKEWADGVMAQPIARQPSFSRALIVRPQPLEKV